MQKRGRSDGRPGDVAAFCQSSETFKLTAEGAQKPQFAV